MVVGRGRTCRGHDETAERAESCGGRFGMISGHAGDRDARAASECTVGHGVDERGIDGIEALLGDDRCDPIEIRGE